MKITIKKKSNRRIRRMIFFLSPSPCLWEICFHIIHIICMSIKEFFFRSIKTINIISFHFFNNSFFSFLVCLFVSNIGIPFHFALFFIFFKKFLQQKNDDDYETRNEFHSINHKYPLVLLKEEEEEKGIFSIWQIDDDRFFYSILLLHQKLNWKSFKQQKKN